MSLICPTVTATDVQAFNNQLKVVEPIAKRLHLDIMDGNLAPTKSPGLTDINTPSKEFDLHLMYQDPQNYLSQIISIKPSLVIVHAESNADIPLFATNMRQAGIKTGLALLPGTQVDDIKYILPHIQHVLIFGGHLGYHGGQADLSQLFKASQIKEISRHIELAWDGGANPDNVVQIKDAGVDVINVGSSIHKSANAADSFNTLQSLVN